MKANLIYLYFVSLLACLALSCSSDTPDDPAIEKGDAIVLAPEEVSRATSTNDLSEFTIYGNMKFRDNEPTLIFNNTKVTYSNGGWNYDDTQYWFPKHEFSFVAISPADDPALSNVGFDNSTSQLSFTYTVPDNVDSADDLMVATHRRMYTTQSSTPTPVVRLKFNHVMSRIDFKVKNNGAADKIQVTNVKIEGVNKKGTVSITSAPLLSNSQTDDHVNTWTNVSNPSNIISNINVIIPEDGTFSLFPDDNALFAIPQSTNNIKITITYKTLYEGLPPGGLSSEELTVVAAAPQINWESGKMYTYDASINEITKDIYVTVSVKDWQSATSSIVVPES